MKKIFLLAVSLTIFSITYAQKGFYVGGLLGVGQSSLTPSSLDNQTNKLFLGAGVRGIYHFNRYFGIEADGLITSKGTRATGTAPAVLGSEDYEERYDFIYAEVPMLAHIRIGAGNFFFKGFAGPSFNFNIDARYSIDYANSNNNDVTDAKVNNLTVMETSLVYGAGVEIGSNGGLYSLTVRINRGLTSIATSSQNNNDIYNQYFAICLGWSTY